MRLSPKEIAHSFRSGHSGFTELENRLLSDRYERLNIWQEAMLHEAELLNIKEDLDDPYKLMHRISLTIAEAALERRPSTIQS